MRASALILTIEAKEKRHPRRCLFVILFLSLICKLVVKLLYLEVCSLRITMLIKDTLVVEITYTVKVG